MTRQRTLGRLVKSFGLALAITKADKYFQDRKTKKLKRLSTDVEDDIEINIVIIGVEV